MLSVNFRRLSRSCIVLTLLGSCAVFKTADYATAVFLREPDPALAQASLPALMKLTEGLLLADPKNPGKALTTASLYVMYANAFLEGEAFLLPDDAYEEKRALTVRAGSLYRRAVALLLPIILSRSPGFFALDYSAPSALSEQLAKFGKKDVPLLYWTAAAVLSAFANDPMDFDNAARIAGTLALLERAIALDPDWNGGGLHELAITVYGSLPADLGGDKEKAKAAFASAKAATGGTAPGPFVSYAASVCVSERNAEEFRVSLDTALGLPDRSEYALTDSLAKRRSRRLLDDISLYF